MRLFLQYLRARRKLLLCFFIFCLVFLLSFWLYHLPLAAVLYPAALCAFLGLLVMLRSFLRLQKKHQLLTEQQEGIRINAIRMPPPASPLEKDYQALVALLAEEKMLLEEKQSYWYTDLTDYYTAWVHQIKIPIASMRLKLAAQDSGPTRELSVDLQRIEQYVEMVLCYLRLDSGTTDYVIQECDLDAIIRQAVKKFASQFIARKIRLDYEPLHCLVLTDEKWLLFVVEQVLSNALKYTRSGSVAIGLEPPLTLCVRDTGIGIAPEDLPRIFEKGYTGYNGRIDKKASGIGLYLCKRICKNLGHSISASSSPDSGTVIRINLKSSELELE